MSFGPSQITRFDGPNVVFSVQGDFESVEGNFEDAARQALVDYRGDPASDPASQRTPRLSDLGHGNVDQEMIGLSRGNMNLMSVRGFAL